LAYVRTQRAIQARFEELLASGGISTWNNEIGAPGRCQVECE